MKKEKLKKAEPVGDEPPSLRVRLPGFIIDEDVGLGTVVKRVTSTFGIRPCGACEQRAARLNRWIGFTGSRRK
jgi:hypothetical protein